MDNILRNIYLNDLVVKIKQITQHGQRNDLDLITALSKQNICF